MFEDLLCFTIVEEAWEWLIIDDDIILDYLLFYDGFVLQHMTQALLCSMSLDLK